MSDFERMQCLERALTALRGYSNTPMGILGRMPEGVDGDIWEMATKLEEALENRILALSKGD